MSIAVLTYHACNVLGNEYADNDHRALASDLETIAEQGYRVVSLSEALAVAANCPDERLVALTFDDGPVFDFEDFDHPDWGVQKSFYRLMCEFAERHGSTPVASSFVIASPAAREEMDRVDFASRDWWHDRWWRQARDSGMLEIENHSWDHNHPSLSKTAHKHNQRGTFDTIDSLDECQAEVRQASDYIHRVAGRRPHFFAYPLGQASEYLRGQYLPEHAGSLGIKAAFSIEPGWLNADQDRWYLPRFVCGLHWRSTAQLIELLQS